MESNSKTSFPKFPLKKISSEPRLPSLFVESASTVSISSACSRPMTPPVPSISLPSSFTNASLRNSSSLLPRERSGPLSFSSENDSVPQFMLVLNPTIEGNLKMKHKGIWKHRFVVLDPNSLYVFHSDRQTKGTPVQISLFLCSIKSNPKNKNRFHLVTASETYKFEAKNETMAQEWIVSISNICNTLTQQSRENNQLPGAIHVSDSCYSDSNSSSSYGSFTTGNKSHPDSKCAVLSLLDSNGNDRCADCGSNNPEWCSINLGVFICIECSGIHRNLGSHISKVRSVTLDVWEEEHIRAVSDIGNVRANAEWEANIPFPFEKPKPNDPIGIKKEWIQAKYELGLFRKSNSTTIESLRT